MHDDELTFEPETGEPFVVGNKLPSHVRRALVKEIARFRREHDQGG